MTLTRIKKKASLAMRGAFAVLSLASMSGCQPQPLSEQPSPLAQQQTVSGPDVPANAIWRAYFALGEKAIQPDKVNATGFACRFPTGEKKTTYLVTVLHAAEERETPFTELDEVERIRQSIRTIGATEAYGASDSMKVIGMMADPPTDQLSDESSILYDVALVEPGKVGMKAFGLAAAPVTVDSKVYLATAVYGGAPASQTTHEAKITAVNPDGTIAYRFVNERLSLQAADGAPLLDESGEVVGMHVHADEATDGVAGVGISMPDYWKRYTESLDS